MVEMDGNEPPTRARLGALLSSLSYIPVETVERAPRIELGH